MNAAGKHQLCVSYFLFFCSRVFGKKRWFAMCPVPQGDRTGIKTHLCTHVPFLCPGIFKLFFVSLKVIIIIGFYLSITSLVVKLCTLHFLSSQKVATLKISLYGAAILYIFGAQENMFLFLFWSDYSNEVNTLLDFFLPLEKLRGTKHCVTFSDKISFRKQPIIPKAFFDQLYKAKVGTQKNSTHHPTKNAYPLLVFRKMQRCTRKKWKWLCLISTFHFCGFLIRKLSSFRRG